MARRKVKLLRIERMLIKFCVFLLVMIPASSVFGKAMLSKTNLEVERLKKEISAQERKNQSLTMKVNELQSFENILEVAKNQGLAYNSNNIKVID
ncbi:MAG TPA: cell division protein FtsL [Mollicutes bacterium]|nr:cell division protein FtsL [Mollicutes bacterium]